MLLILPRRPTFVGPGSRIAFGASGQFDLSAHFHCTRLYQAVNIYVMHKKRELVWLPLLWRTGRLWPGKMVNDLVKDQFGCSLLLEIFGFRVRQALSGNHADDAVIGLVQVDETTITLDLETHIVELDRKQGFAPDHFSQKTLNRFLARDGFNPTENFLDLLRFHTALNCQNTVTPETNAVSMLLFIYDFVSYVNN